MNRFLRLLHAAGLCAASAGATLALAHEPWILPSPFSLEEPGWISFDISNSHRLFVPEESPLHDFYQIELIGPDGGAATPPSFWSGRFRIAGEAHLDKQGTYLLAEYSLRPIYDTRLRSGEVIGAAKDEAPAGQAVRTDRFLSSVKAFVNVGQPSPVVFAPRDYPVELVPLGDPGAVHAGQPLDVQMLVDGKPAAAAECLADPEGTGPNVPEKPDAPHAKTTENGKATLLFPRPGVWLVRCQQQLPTPQDPKADYSTYRAYLILEVQDSAATP